MKRYNKATAAALAGALVTAAALWPLESELQGALQTVLTTALVWLVPNIAPAGEGRPA